jgi:hypothetical protein
VVLFSRFESTMASGDIRKWFMKQPAKTAPAPVSFAFSELLWFRV